MPRENSTNWSSGDNVSATRLQQINADLDNLYSKGSDRLKVYASTGLNILIGAGVYRAWSTEWIYAGGTVAMTDNATNYVMINPSGSIIVSTSAWDTSNIKLAVVTTVSGVITSIVIWRVDAIGWVIWGWEWTYLSKKTFSNSSTQQDFTSLAAHDYYRLVFNVYNHGARLTMNVWVNWITWTAYLYFYMALTPYVNNNQAAWKVYDTGATADDIFKGDFVIGWKYLTASNMKSIFGVGSGGNTNASMLTGGTITGNAADVSSIEIKPTNAISWTVELWYKDNQ